jgi:hypothetical protein
MYNSYYGNFRTRTFADIFPDVETWFASEETCPIGVDLEDSGLLSTEHLYYLLYARYGNSHIAYSDENQFEYALWSIVFQYGPTASKKFELQTKLRGLSDEELVLGGKAIYNTAYNPGTQPSTSTLEELTAINQQNTTNYKKSKLEAYATVISLLDNDVLDEFLRKFSKLFITVAEPDYPLWYVTENESEDLE